jgi:hypothetical protein
MYKCESGAAFTELTHADRHKRAIVRQVPKRMRPQVDVSRFDRTLKLVQQHRIKRGRSDKILRKKTRIRQDLESDMSSDHVECFLCHERLPNDPSLVNSHIDACLASGSQPQQQQPFPSPPTSETEQNREEFVEYTWAGQTRIRG